MDGILSSTPRPNGAAPTPAGARRSARSRDVYDYRAYRVLGGLLTLRLY